MTYQPTMEEILTTLRRMHEADERRVAAYRRAVNHLDPEEALRFLKHYQEELEREVS